MPTLTNENNMIDVIVNIIPKIIEAIPINEIFVIILPTLVNS